MVTDHRVICQNVKSIWILVLSIFFALLILGGCGKKPLPPPEWHFQQQAIRFSLKSDPRLNLYQGTPHTLVICMYQLSDPNDFNLFSQDEQGIMDLLACRRFDPSVVNFKRVIVQPGIDQNLSMDRAEGARYVGLAAGYFNLYKDKVVRLFNIPVIVQEKGFFKKTRKKIPGILDINLYLGPYGIREIGANSGS